VTDADPIHVVLKSQGGIGPSKNPSELWGQLCVNGSSDVVFAKDNRINLHSEALILSPGRDLKPLIYGVVLIELVLKKGVEALLRLLFLKDLTDFILQLLFIHLLGVFGLVSDPFLNEEDLNIPGSFQGRGVLTGS
jgi:hypothetical protein